MVLLSRYRRMAMTLGQVEDKDGNSRGLVLFYVETRNEKNQWNGVQVNRLKDKLGIRALPTAELTLNGTKAHLISSPGEGIERIATLFNITRIYNSNAAASFMRRVTDLALSYAYKREAFGKKLIDHPLHLETLAASRYSERQCFAGSTRLYARKTAGNWARKAFSWQKESGKQTTGLDRDVS